MNSGSKPADRIVWSVRGMTLFAFARRGYTERSVGRGPLFIRIFPRGTTPFVAPYRYLVTVFFSRLIAVAGGDPVTSRCAGVQFDSDRPMRFDCAPVIVVVY